MLWVAAQAESASLKLELAAERYVAGQANEEELAKRYQVFLSRIKLLNQGPQHEAMIAMGFDQTLQSFNHNLPSLQASLLKLQTGDYTTLELLRNELVKNSQFWGRVTNKAMVTSWDNLGNTLDQVNQQLLRILSTMIGLLVAGTVIIIHLWLAMHEAKKNAAAFLHEHQSAETYRNFGTMISHQFRTPLAIIDSSMQRLIRRSGKLNPEEIRQRGSSARSAVARLIRLIDSVLEAAAMEAGQFSYNSDTYNVDALFKLSHQKAQETAPDKNIIIKKTTNSSLNAFCDRVHTEQIFDILLTNALKYSPKNSPVTVQLTASGGWVECRVSNQRSLLGNIEKDDIFKRYYRGENAQGTKGLGIGLYMAKNLALQQQGKLTVEEDHQTITFVLLLPQSKECANDAT